MADTCKGKAGEQPVDAWIARQLRRYLNWKHVQTPESGWAVMCQLAGSILMARAMASETTGKKVLDASKHFLENTIFNKR